MSLSWKNGPGKRLPLNVAVHFTTDHVVMRGKAMSSVLCVNPSMEMEVFFRKLGTCSSGSWDRIPLLWEEEYEGIRDH